MRDIVVRASGLHHSFPPAKVGWVRKAESITTICVTQFPLPLGECRAAGIQRPFQGAAE